MSKQNGIRMARRLEEVGFSDIVQTRNRVMQLRAEGLAVHAMHMGEPFFETPDAIKNAATRALAENQTHYAPSSGVLALRQALVEKLAAKNSSLPAPRSDRDRGRNAGPLCRLPNEFSIPVIMCWSFRPTGRRSAISSPGRRRVRWRCRRSPRAGTASPAHWSSSPPPRPAPSTTTLRRTPAESFLPAPRQKSGGLRDQARLDCLCRRGLRRSGIRRRACLHRLAAGDGRAHDQLLHLLQDLCHDRMARRVRGGSGALHDRPEEGGAVLDQRRFDTDAICHDRGAQDAGNRDRRACARSTASGGTCWWPD